MNRPFTIVYEYEKDIACPNCTTPTFQLQQSVKTIWAENMTQAKDKFNAIQYDVNVRIVEIRDDFAIASAMAEKEKQQEEMAKRKK